MRVTRSSALRRAVSALMKCNGSEDPNQYYSSLPVFDRRHFLEKTIEASGVTLALCSMPQVVNAQDDSFDVEMEKQFYKLLSLEKEEYEDSIKKFLASGKKEDTHKFINWLTRKMENVSNKKEAYVLEKICRLFVYDSFEYVDAITNELRAKKLLPLFPGYVNLIKKFSNDSEFLNSALLMFVELESLGHGEVSRRKYSNDDSPLLYIHQAGIEIGNKELRGEIAQNMQTLFELVLDGINRFPQAKSYFTRQVFTALQGLTDSDIEKMDFLFDPLSQIYFQKNKGDIEGMECFVDSVLKESEFGGRSVLWTHSMVLRIISDNKDYFEASVQKLIDGVKKPQNTSERISAMNKLAKSYIFFYTVPKIISYRDTEGKSQTWANKEILTPVNNLFSSLLNDEHVTLELVPSKREKYIHDKVWNCLNENMKLMLSANPELLSGFLNILRERLKRDVNPYDREMDYVSIGTLARHELQKSSESTSLELLKKELVQEKTFQAARGAGRALSSLMVDERRREKLSVVFNPSTGNYYNDQSGKFMTYEGFIGDLERSSKQQALLELRSQALSPAQQFIVDLVRLVEWDTDFYKELLPGHTFESFIKDDRGNEVKNLDDFLEALRLRHMAFVALANSASNLRSHDFDRVRYNIVHPITKDYKETVVNILERDLGIYSNPNSWGEEAANLTEIYRSISGEDQAFMDSKMAFFHKHYFGEDGLFKRYEQGSLALKEEKNGRKKLDEEQIKEVKKDVEKTKRNFAIRFLSSAPSRSFSVYHNYLEKIGYPSYELDGLREETLIMASN